MVIGLKVLKWKSNHPVRFLTMKSWYVMNFTPNFDLVSTTSEEKNIFNLEDFIPSSKDEKLHLYLPHRKSLIIKVFERKVGYWFLLTNL